MNEKSFVEETQDFSKNLDIGIVKKFVVFNEISSTNIKAKELAQKGEPEGTIVLSEIQKQGRGRFDRTWESPEGGLYLSIILRPTCKSSKATLLPLLAALSVCKTIKSVCDLPVAIKWPNDVLIDGKKVCGILLESESSKDGLGYVVLGMGINLNIDIDVFSKDFVATSISHEIGIKLDYYGFLKKLLLNLDYYYQLFKEEKYNNILSEWKKNSDTIGKRVCINTSSEKMEGKAFDVNQSGFLIIEMDSGEHKRITSGDCFYIE